MNFGREWITLIALAAIISSVLTALIPKTSLKRTFKILTSIVLIYVFVSPINKSMIDSLKNADFDFLSKEEYSYEFQSNGALSVETAFKSGIESLIAEYLADEKINYEEIEITCNGQGENLTLSKVVIYCDKNVNNLDVAKYYEKIKALLCMDFQIEFKERRDR